MDQYTEDIVYQWEKTWSERNIESLVEACAQDTVGLPHFLKYLPKDSTVLECGCGLGQWLIYLERQGYRMAGVEIAPGAVATHKKFFPNSDIRVGDVRAMPYQDGVFGGYISIGVLEHMIEGPDQTIREMSRVLKSGGVAVITVPAFNYVMRLWYPIRKMLVNFFRHNAIVRRMMGKPPLAGTSSETEIKLTDIQRNLHPDFWPSIGVDPEKGPMFIEYKCKKGLIGDKLKAAGFEIVEEAPIFHPILFHDVFGDMFFAEGDPIHPETLRLNAAGRLLNGLFQTLSPHVFNYVYLYVARKK